MSDYESDSSVGGDDTPDKVLRMTVSQLRERMKELGQKNYSRLNKAQLRIKVTKLENSKHLSPHPGSLSPTSPSGTEEEIIPKVGTKRKNLDWQEARDFLKKRQKTTHTVKKTDKKQPVKVNVPESPMKSSTSSLALEFDDESVDEPSIDIETPKKPTVLMTKPSMQFTPPKPIENSWIQRKKPSDTPGLDSYGGSSGSLISPKGSETDLLDSLTKPTRLSEKNLLDDDEEDESLILDLSGISENDLPKTPLKKTTHSIVLSNLEEINQDNNTSISDEEESSEFQFAFTPKKKSNHNNNREKPKPKRILDDSDSDGLPFDDSPISHPSDKKEDNNLFEESPNSPTSTFLFENSPPKSKRIVKKSKYTKKVILSPNFNSSGESPVGTQVINEGTLPLPDEEMEDTEIIDEEEQGKLQSSGTQVIENSPIQSSNGGGTQIIGDDDTSIIDESPSRTQVLPEETSGTLVLGNDNESDLFEESENFLDNSPKKDKNKNKKYHDISPLGGTLPIDSSSDDEQPTFIIPSQGNDDPSTLKIDEDDEFVGFGSGNSREDPNLQSPTQPTGDISDEDNKTNKKPSKTLTANERRKKFLNKERNRRKLNSKTPSPPQQSNNDHNKEIISSAQNRRDKFKKRMQKRRNIDFSEGETIIAGNNNNNSPVRADSESTLQTEPFECDGTLAIEENDDLMDDDTSAMLLMRTPEQIRKPTRKPSAIPLTPSPSHPNVPATLKVSDITSSYNDSVPNSSIGRLIPIYSFRNIINLSSNLSITMGSDNSCSIIFSYDSRVSPKHCELVVQHNRVIVKNLRFVYFFCPKYS